MKIFRIITAMLCVCFLLPAKGRAEQPGNSSAQIQMLQSQMQELTQIVRELKTTVDSQRREIDSLKAVRDVQVPALQGSISSSSPRFGTKILPEIGAVADMALKLDSPRSDTGGADRLSVREVELILGGNVDPYSRFDSTIAFNEESTAEFEEAYLTRFELPLDMTARIGRFKPRIGKVLAMHRDSLDTVDEPLVIQRYFGTEGMNKTGADITKLLDLPSPMVHQVTFGVLEGGNGEGGTVFGSTKRRPTLYGRLKNFIDISDETNLEIGFSDALGSRDEDQRFEVNVLGIDSTLIHHLSPTQDLKFQGEIFNVNRKESFVVDDATGRFNSIDGNVWGGYGLIDFRISSQWAAGFRLDDVEIVDRPVASPNHADLGYTGYLTFYQSEFARWRLQFTHLDLTNGSADNQVWLQGTFGVGEHKHKLQ